MSSCPTALPLRRHKWHKAAACADVQTAGDPGAHTLDPVPSAWEPLQGGSGGSSFGPLECPAGSVATGLQTETNSYVVRIRLLCRAITLAYP